MPNYALTPPKVPSVAIHGSETRFPVRRIFCVGKNYADHVREMGGDPKSDPPVFFTKPADALVADGATIPYPPGTEDFHYEGELVVAIHEGGAGIAEADALNHVWGYGAGNDLTRRDLQHQAKAKGRPWDMAKGFDLSAVCGALYPAADLGHPDAAQISTAVNGETVQNSNTDAMIWSVPEIIEGLSALVTLEPGDLIFTGTPDGIGPLVSGDSCIVTVEGYGSATVTIA